MELQDHRDSLARQGLGLAAISYDPVAVLADFSARRGIRFPLLSDVGSVTIKNYGIFNTIVPPTNQQSFGIPFPGTFMVNVQRIVTARFFEPAYQERMTAGSILARIGTNDEVPATRLSSPQLEVSTYASDATVAPGTHFSVVLDVRPARGMQRDRARRHRRSREACQRRQDRDAVLRARIAVVDTPAHTMLLEESIELVAGRDVQQLAKLVRGDPVHPIRVDDERLERGPRQITAFVRQLANGVIGKIQPDPHRSRIRS